MFGVVLYSQQRFIEVALYTEQPYVWSRDTIRIALRADLQGNQQLTVISYIDK